jgi:DNA-binding response OmpR family regulator
MIEYEPMRILVIEDEHKIANSIKKGLEMEGFAVDLAFDGEEGFILATSEPYDAITLDLFLPKMDGVTLAKKLRSDGNHTPILMLTAKSQVEDRVEGLNSGADDYLPKPFAFEELLARIKAITRRPKAGLPTKLKIKELTLDTITYEVKINGKIINVSKKEFSLLEYFMRHPGQILSKEKLINHVWDYDANILPNTVEVYVGYLRKKIPGHISTIRGFGYKIGENTNG